MNNKMNWKFFSAILIGCCVMVGIINHHYNKSHSGCKEGVAFLPNNDPKVVNCDTKEETVHVTAVTGGIVVACICPTHNFQLDRKE